MVELEIKQDLTARGGLRYSGPITVTIQELDIYNNVMKCFYMKEIYLDVFRSSESICLFLLWQHLFLAMECHFKMI